MHNSPSTDNDDHQSRAQNTPQHWKQPPTDLTAAEWFCRNVAERAEASARVSGINEGLLMLSSFGELPVASPGEWKTIAPRSKPFAPAEHKAMADLAVTLAREPGRNVYLPMVL